MTEIRLHGRGGQGVVTGAELIAIAAFYDGKQSQAFPYFGVERRGAPIEAYARIDDKFINLREQIKEPDILIIQDATVLGNVDVLKGLKNNGIILINTSKDLKNIFKDFGEISSGKIAREEILKIKKDKKTFKLIRIDGNGIALKILGRPIVNTLMTLKLAQATNIISLKAVQKALKEKFSGETLKKNLALMNEISVC
ncbi:MAG: 2-oxoacid:acceptor oxidoreductase family protein [bacterium]